MSCIYGLQTIHGTWVSVDACGLPSVALWYKPAIVWRLGPRCRVLRYQRRDQVWLLSPTLYLFLNFFLSDVDDVLQTQTLYTWCYPKVHIYADEYFGVTGNAVDCQIMIETCRSHSLKWRWGPNLGVDKTRTVIFEPKNALVTANVLVMWDNKVINVQITYRLLGSTFSSSCKWDAHLAKLRISARGKE